MSTRIQYEYIPAYGHRAIVHSFTHTYIPKHVVEVGNGSHSLAVDRLGISKLKVDSSEVSEGISKLHMKSSFVLDYYNVQPTTYLYVCEIIITCNM